MSWLQLEFAVQSADVETLEETLLAHAALAITLASEADEQILEPAPGATPLWSLIRLSALMPLDVDLAQLRSALAAGFQQTFEIKFIGEADWQAQAQQYAANRVFAGRLHLCPPEAPASSEFPEAQRLLLEPGMAFGSGTHPTTQLCLAWLAAHINAGDRVLDYGAGSGILAIGACLLGASAVAVDYDQQAVIAAEENGLRNGLRVALESASVDADLRVMHSDTWLAQADNETFDVVVANILAEPLRQLAATLQGHMRAGSRLVLSGLLAEQVAEVTAAYTDVRFDEPELLDGWACLVGHKVAS